MDTFYLLSDKTTQNELRPAYTFTFCSEYPRFINSPERQQTERDGPGQNDRLLRVDVSVFILASFIVLTLQVTNPKLLQVYSVFQSVAASGSEEEEEEEEAMNRGNNIHHYCYNNFPNE